MTAIDLIGDGIENPCNARTMINVAGMFGARCLFRDRKNLMETICSNKTNSFDNDIVIPGLIDMDQITSDYRPVVCLENDDGAASVYGFKLQNPGLRAALVAGNERRGIAGDLKKLSDQMVQIPMSGSAMNTLNVAAASAVALYYLHSGSSGKLARNGDPDARRPELLLLGPKDHVELGSAIRSACAFGWNRIYVEDSSNVWFDCDRAIRSEGRGAARRGRNPIRVIPTHYDTRFLARQVVVASTTVGVPVHRARLAEGAKLLIVIPDESNGIEIEGSDWERFGDNIQFVRTDVPSESFVYHYRAIASIVMAEAARQIGHRRTIGTAKSRQWKPGYESGLTLLDSSAGQTIYLDNLLDY